jgi:hypothetical protein
MKIRPSDTAGLTNGSGSLRSLAAKI